MTYRSTTSQAAGDARCATGVAAGGVVVCGLGRESEPPPTLAMHSTKMTKAARRARTIQMILSGPIFKRDSRLRSCGPSSRP